MTLLLKALGRAGLAVVSVLFTLAALECGARIVGVAPLPRTFGGLPPNHPLRRLLKPNKCESSGRPDGAYFVENCTNSLGLRDREHASDESPRVLGLGDAFTGGWGVDQGDTFLAALERALRLALPKRRPGVFNAGLDNTAQAHQQSLLRHVYDLLRPDVVVVAFSEDDDIDENLFWNPNLGVYPEIGELTASDVQACLDEQRGDAAGGFWFRHFALVRFFRQRAVRASMAAEVSALDGRLHIHGLQGAPLNAVVSGEARRRFRQAFTSAHEGDWSVTRVLLERIQRIVADHGGRMVLLRIPSKVSLDDATWAAARERFCTDDPAILRTRCIALDRDHTARRLRAHASSHGLVYVDPGDALSRALARGERVYLPNDNHLSRLGHALIGERVAAALLPILGGGAPQSAAPKSPPERKQRRVGAYWYPQYHSQDFSAFTDYTPRGGGYVSKDPASVAQQLQLAERGELDFFLIELLAEQNADSQFSNRAVDAIVNAISERRRRGESRMEFAILSHISTAETGGKSDRWLNVTRNHLDQIWMQYVNNYGDAFVRVDGKPLVAILSPPVPIDDQRFTIIRPHWLPHEQWKEQRQRELLPLWDTSPQTVTDRRFVSVIPGYNDWRLERRPQLAPYVPRLAGRTFVEQWKRVFEVDPEIVLVYSFNEYFEQTQIEPTIEQGDRYLLLNQLLASRFKEGRPYTAEELARLPDILEPPARSADEKVKFLRIDDPRVTLRGLKLRGGGRAELLDEGEVDIENVGDRSVVVGFTQLPTFDRCASVAATLAGDPSRTSHFSGERTPLFVLRDLSIPATNKHVKLLLHREPAAGCRDSGRAPIVFTGIALYSAPPAERKDFHLWQESVKLEGFWDIEKHSSGDSFSWSRGNSTVTISSLTPEVRYAVTLTFLDTAGFTDLGLGPDKQHLRTVNITPASTATLPEPITVSAAGTLSFSMQTHTWRPSQRFHSTDQRTLGLALRLVTLDRVGGPSLAQQHH